MKTLGLGLVISMALVGLASGCDEDPVNNQPGATTTATTGVTTTTTTTSTTTTTTSSSTGSSMGGNGGSGGEPGVEILDPTVDHYGQSAKEWAASWWQWVYGTPATGHPLFDETGADCHTGQSGEVFFLGGTFGGAPVTRACTIGDDKAVFFPVVNRTCFDPMEQLTDLELQGFATTFIDGIDDMSVEIDGTLYDKNALFPTYRVGLYHSYFTVAMTDDLFTYWGAPIDLSGAILETFGDGVYLMLAPLPLGEHVIKIYALEDKDTPTDTTDDFVVDVTYNLTVE